jgi:hypothetical protein
MTGAAFAIPAVAAEPTAAEEANRVLVADFCAAFATRNMTKIASYLAPTCSYRITEGLVGWLSTVDGLGEKRVAVKKDERSAKDACLVMALAILQRRGEWIPICLSDPHWSRQGVLESRAE